MGAAVWPGGVASPTLRRRCDAAARLYSKGGFTTVIPSGGIGRHAPAEAVLMRDIMVGHGVPLAAIRLEDRAKTTMETAQNVVTMLRAGACVTVVSDGYHLPRSAMAFRGHDLRVRVHSARSGTPKPRRLLAARMWLRELAALPYYAVRIVVDRRLSRRRSA